jgi:hypothetical protein
MQSVLGEPQVLVFHPVCPELQVDSVELSVHCV